MPVYRLGETVPSVHPDAFVHPDAVVIGDVILGAFASVWPGAALRGDFGRIEIGERTSIQDGTIVHAGGTWPTRIGADCVVGHLVHLEGSAIDDRVLVGSGSIVLRAVVRTGAIVAAGALVPNGFEVPSGFRAQGVPATLVANSMTPEWIEAGAQQYVALAQRYRRELQRVDP